MSTTPERDDSLASLSRRRSPLVAATLSAVICPGLGQIYCHRTRRGLVMMAVALPAVFVAAASGRGGALLVVLLLTMGGTGWDAYRLARGS